MSAAARPADVLELFRKPFATCGEILDTQLAQDEYVTLRDQGGRLGDRSLFAHLSDLDLACVYEHGPAHLHDAAYCELHLRQLTPWKIVSYPALELVL